MNKHISMPECKFSIEFIYVKPGSCVLGFDPTSSYAAKANSHEKQRTVIIEKPFYLAKYPITNFQLNCLFCWERKNVLNPAVTRYFDHVKLLDLLSLFFKIKVELPTIDQWEFAYRAGTKTNFYYGNELNEKMTNISNKITPVNAFPPNPWGFCDMSGNLWELCKSPTYLNNSDTSFLNLKGGNLKNSTFCTTASFLGNFNLLKTQGMAATTSFIYKSDSRKDYIGIRPCINI